MTFLAVLVALLLQEGHAIALPTLWKARARFQDLKVYVHKDFNLTGNCSAEHPYTDTASRVVVGADSVLWPVRDWLWKHDEYISVELLMHLASCGLQRVSRAADADLCYPHCHNTKLHKWSGRYSGQMVEIKTATPHRFHDCKALQLHMEGAHPFNMERCHVVVPYFHGVYAPLKPLEPLRTPWNLVTKRDHFLSFFGGGKRGARSARAAETGPGAVLRACFCCCRRTSCHVQTRMLRRRRLRPLLTLPPPASWRQRDSKPHVRFPDPLTPRRAHTHAHDLSCHRPTPTRAGRAACKSSKASRVRTNHTRASLNFSRGRTR